jgi:homoserine O-acetyltransferase
MRMGGSVWRRGAGIAVTLAALCAAAARGQTAKGDGALQIAYLGKCALESGAVIKDCRIGYRTFGHLDTERDNAVLMPTWLFGTSADLEGMFGDLSKPEQLVDTRKYFGIAIDALGDGVSSSPSSSTSQRGTKFPQFTERDMVEAEYRVMTEVLGLKHLHAVVGLSMGGEQTFDWAVAHPEFFDLAVPILGTPRLTPYDLETKTIQIGTIVDDPEYDHGKYTREPALKLANLFGNLTVTTAEDRNATTTREGFAAFVKQAEAPQALDANDRVWQLRAIVQQDVIGKQSLEDAARATRARFLVIVNANDHLVNPEPALAWARAKNAPVYISHGACGHLIMNCDAAAVSSRVREFLATGSLK